MKQKNQTKEILAELGDNISKQIKREKVYIVVGIWDYEGEQNLGVFSNKKKAEKYKKEQKADKVNNYDSYDIEEHLLN